jgi:hypothetical protein
MKIFIVYDKTIYMRKAMFNQIVASFPDIEFRSSGIFAWRPHLQAIEYDEEKIATSRGLLLLLHEVGHHMSGHDRTSFRPRAT